MRNEEGKGRREGGEKELIIFIKREGRGGKKVNVVLFGCKKIAFRLSVGFVLPFSQFLPFVASFLSSRYV